MKTCQFSFAIIVISYQYHLVFYDYQILTFLQDSSHFLSISLCDETAGFFLKCLALCFSNHKLSDNFHCSLRHTHEQTANTNFVIIVISFQYYSVFCVDEKALLYLSCKSQTIRDISSWILSTYVGSVIATTVISYQYYSLFCWSGKLTIREEFSYSLSNHKLSDKFNTTDKLNSEAQLNIIWRNSNSVLPW